MDLSKKRYSDIYRLQDKVLTLLAGRLNGLYLTGGTALGRFFLHHRYSEDLDLFANRNPDFKEIVGEIRRFIRERFRLSDDKLVQYEDFVRIWIDEDPGLKIEFVNDVEPRWGDILFLNEIPLDNPANILSNKLSALVSRDEPKDVYDIVTLARHYSLNWDEVFSWTVKKAWMAETDIAMRLRSFPVEWLQEVDWFIEPVDPLLFKTDLDKIAGDFTLALDNSLGRGRIPITEARPGKGG